MTRLQTGKTRIGKPITYYMFTNGQMLLSWRNEDDREAKTGLVVTCQAKTAKRIATRTQTTAFELSESKFQELLWALVVQKGDRGFWKAINENGELAYQWNEVSRSESVSNIDR